MLTISIIAYLVISSVSMILYFNHLTAQHKKQNNKPENKVSEEKPLEQSIREAPFELA